MKLALFTYHADFATGECFYRTITRSGVHVLKVGMAFGAGKSGVASMLDELNDMADVELLFFVDPPGPNWPLGFENAAFPTVGYLIDVHRSIDVRLAYAPFFDHIFVAQKDFVEVIRNNSYENVSWLPLGCDPEIHKQPSSERDIEVGFVGKLGAKGTKRREVLDIVLKKFHTNDVTQFYPPRDMAEIYGRSQIVFNASIGGDLNMRIFEAMASGALLVTDRIENGIHELFEEGKHYVTYSTAQEAIEKIRYYLANPKEAREIAECANKLVLVEHTYSKRWGTICEILNGDIWGQARIRNVTYDQKRDFYAAVFEHLKLPYGIWRLARNSSSFRNVIALFRPWVRTILKKLNSIIPFTPNAIKTRLKR